MTFERVDAFYDLHVPGAESYFLNGLLHHNTGKSRAVGQYLLYLATQNPGCRIAVVRKTRVDLTEAFLVTWEDKVLADGQDATYLKQPLAEGPTRAGRRSYEFKNGSVMVPLGMDSPTRLYSTEWDVIYVQEAIELTEDEWERLTRGLRNKRIPHPAGNHPSGEKRFLHQLIGDTNPDSPEHWLKRRCDAGLTLMLHSRHADNPSLSQDDLDVLRSLTGVRRDRLYLGLWVQAESAIWSNYNHLKHVVDACPFTPEWHFSVVDWGFRDPGVMQTYAVGPAREACMVHEAYMTGRNSDWWCEQALAVQKRFDPRVFVCDPSRPDSIDLFNHRLYLKDGRNCAVPAMNEFEAGANIVRDRLASDGRLTFMRHALVEQDQLLLEKKRPVRTVQEIPGYCFKETKPGQRSREEPASGQPDHGCDCVRYGMAYLDYSLYESEKPKPKDAPGTLGHELGMQEAFERMENQ